MYVLILVVLLSGDEMTFAPGGKAAQFDSKAACEAQAVKEKAALAKEPIGPFTLECRKA